MRPFASDDKNGPASLIESILKKKLNLCASLFNGQAMQVKLGFRLELPTFNLLHTTGNRLLDRVLLWPLIDKSLFHGPQGLKKDILVTLLPGSRRQNERLCSLTLLRSRPFNH